MDAIHFHLLINHLPILGSLFAFLLLACGGLFRSAPISKAGLVTMVIVAISSIPANKSGEEAEHLIKEMQLERMSKHELHEHEEHAESALPVMLVTGALALLTLIGWQTGRYDKRWPRVLVLTLSLICFILMAMVGNHGGKILRPEIRKEASSY